MSNYIDPMSPVEVSTLIATDIQATAMGTLPAREELAEVISEVQLQTQTLGASLLHITLIDPAWAILRTGWLNVTSDGLLDEIECEFPKGTGMWWRLAMVELSNDLSQPNLTLTFQDRIVAWLQDKSGPIGVAPGTTTRAQFFKQLIDQVGQGDGLPEKIVFVCPELNQLQAVQPTTNTVGQTAVLNTVTAKNAADKANKAKGVGNGAQITIKGATPTAQQIDNINVALSIAVQLSAPPLAVQALVEACIQESSFMNLSYGDGTSTGILQFEAGTAKDLGINPMDVTACITAFLTDHYYTEPGVNYGPSPAGAIATATANPSFTADQIAQATQGSAHPAAYGQWADESKAIIQAAGGVSTLDTISPPSDVSQLTRGTADNPDENSWDCMQRLATEVNWSLFSNADILYYMDGPTLQAQKPAVYLRLDDTGTTWTAINPPDGDTATDVVSNLSATFDNTAFDFQETHKRKGKIQRKTGVKTPQTPAQIKMNMICGVLDYRAGDVFVFQNSGPLNGRWIVEDATRNCLADRFTQFTLGPPVLPDNEPAATTTGAALSGQTPTPGGSAGQPGTAGNARTPSPSPGALSAPGTWYPPAKRLYAPKLDHGPRDSTSGIVVHVNVGYYASVVPAFAAGGFVAGVGAHFEVGSQTDGPPVQFLPLDRVAWHAGAANGFSVGIEHAGFGASRQEWISGHGNMLSTSATLAAWILNECNMGPPVINTTNVTAARADGSPAGNIWPHNLGGLAWGGHTCPDGPDGVDYFPWDVWGLMVAKAYDQLSAGGVQAPAKNNPAPTRASSTPEPPSGLWRRGPGK